ncbi:hypothetical protein DL95DRAFT_460014 [Leptodontidium sp. 2 PMI_412]|nr:hypothetical protein DL95DRAFT_460014 [Leptodontidium sp. 2 PMI_412]
MSGLEALLPIAVGQVVNIIKLIDLIVTASEAEERLKLYSGSLTLLRSRLNTWKERYENDTAITDRQTVVSSLEWLENLALELSTTIGKFLGGPGRREHRKLKTTRRPPPGYKSNGREVSLLSGLDWEVRKKKGFVEKLDLLQNGTDNLINFCKEIGEKQLAQMPANTGDAEAFKATIQAGWNEWSGSNQAAPSQAQTGQEPESIDKYSPDEYADFVQGQWGQQMQSNQSTYLPQQPGQTGESGTNWASGIDETQSSEFNYLPQTHSTTNDYGMDSRMDRPAHVPADIHRDYLQHGTARAQYNPYAHFYASGSGS